MTSRTKSTAATNRALSHFRDLHGRKRGDDLRNAAAHWLGSIRDMRIAGAYTEHEEAHARRVFTRLAGSLTRLR